MLLRAPALLFAFTVVAAAADQPFSMHALHAVGIQLDCKTCHVPEAAGSVMLKRPGHQQCQMCHADAFGAVPKQKICAQCHSDGAALHAFPQHRSHVLNEFSHAHHLDAKARVNATNGLRADCNFCHAFSPGAAFANPPGHAACSSCHGRPGMRPHLDANSRAADCRGCHRPEAIDSAAPDTAEIGRYAGIRFDHGKHFAANAKQCTDCHGAIVSSNSLATLRLPTMIECVSCHDAAKSMPVQFRISNCQTCHVDVKTGPLPPSHNREVKPAFHTVLFRRDHAAQAAAPDAKCFACHQNVTPSIASRNQCAACHLVMKPASHTARWHDDLHGKYAALDRRECATCHTADYCIRCHNELPRSHLPLPMFKGGLHAQAARLNLRACLTCHTFQNTCSNCHAQPLAPRR